MRIKVGQVADVLYFRLDESRIAESEEVRPGVILDYNIERLVVGVEFLGLAARVGKSELTSLQFNAA